MIDLTVVSALNQLDGNFSAATSSCSRFKIDMFESLMIMCQPDGLSSLRQDDNFFGRLPLFMKLMVS